MKTDNNYAWLKKLAKQVNALYVDLFKWTYQGCVVARDTTKHGDCVKCTFLMTNPDGSKMKSMPTKYAHNLMMLIRMNSKKQYPSLVPTKSNGVPDFCDWDWDQDGHAKCWVYLTLPTNKKRH
jgi:hypothetical protein